jgi:deoxyribodipyrimidine photo-lyase
VKAYSVFTPFWRAWRELPRREVHGAPRAIHAPSRLRAGEIPRAGCPLEDPIGTPAERAGRARMRAVLRDGRGAYAADHGRRPAPTGTAAARR